MDASGAASNYGSVRHCIMENQFSIYNLVIKGAFLSYILCATKIQDLYQHCYGDMLGSEFVHSTNQGRVKDIRYTHFTLTYFMYCC